MVYTMYLIRLYRKSGRDESSTVSTFIRRKGTIKENVLVTTAQILRPAVTGTDRKDIMKRIGIIAEYNPFHTGHAYMLRAVRELAGPAEIVVILSGAFVQRGEPALIDKWARAHMAIQGGADCVVELPQLFVLSSASSFAMGGVALAKALRCDAIAFGTERGTPEDFISLSTMLESRPFQAQRPGNYTVGQEETAFVEGNAPHLSYLLHGPNGLLGVAYARACQKLAPSMEIYTIHRTVGHGEQFRSGSFASASTIRQAITDGDAGMIRPYLTDRGCAILDESLRQGAYTDYDAYHTLCLYASRRLAPWQLETLCAFHEGIEHRWQRTMGTCSNWTDAMAALKTKRYAYSRLCRMNAYVVLGISQDAADTAHGTGPLYIRLLGANAKGRAIIRDVAETSSLPVITKPGKTQSSLSPDARSMLAFDILATDIQSLVFHRPLTAKRDYTMAPYITQ